MTNDALFKELETKLENIGVSKGTIDKLFNMINNGEEVTFGLANTVAEGNSELANEIVTLANEVKNNQNDLYAPLKELFNNNAISGMIVDSFIEDLKNGEELDSSRLKSVVRNNYDLYEKAMALIEQIRNGKEEQQENEEKIVVKEFDNVPKNEPKDTIEVVKLNENILEQNNLNEELIQENISNDDELSIPWDKFKTYVDFENAYNLDHAIGLKLISDLKVYSTISPETLNNVLANENIKTALYGRFNWNDEELQALNQAFYKEFIIFVNRTINNKELVLNNEIKDLKSKKIAEEEELKRIEEEKMKRTLTFGLLKISCKELKETLDKLYNLEINPELLNSLFTNYDAISKNIVHVTQNYINNKEFEITDEEKQVYENANNLYNEVSKYVDGQKQVENDLNNELNKLFVLLSHYQELELTDDVKKYLDVVNNSVKAHLGIYYNNYVGSNKDYLDLENMNVYEYLNNLALNSKKDVEIFRNLLSEHFKENNETEKLSKLNNMELSNFIASEAILNNFNLLSTLENNYQEQEIIDNKEEEKQVNTNDLEDKVVINNFDDIVIINFDFSKMLDNCKPLRLKEEDLKGIKNFFKRRKAKKELNKQNAEDKELNKIVQAAEKSVMKLHELNELEKQVDAYLSRRDQRLKECEFLEEDLPKEMETKEEKTKKIKLPKSAVKILSKFRSEQRSEYKAAKKEIDSIPLENIIDEVSKIDTDLVDIDSKIKGANKEDATKYKKLLKNKEQQKRYALSKLLVIENYKKLDESTVAKLKDYAKNDKILSNTISALDKSVNGSLKAKQEKENKNQEKEIKKQNDKTKKTLNELKDLITQLKEQGIDVNQVIDQINTLDEKEKTVEEELNSRKK